MSARDLARNVVRTLRVSGFQAYLVGGCVRDLLLGRDPVDYDVATDATPAQIRNLFPNCEAVGAHFGVVLVKGAGAHVELATFRSDNSYRDGRHPESVDLVSDPRQDAMRRDFTINALLRDPETGQVLDYVGGEQDLRNRLVRAIGDPTARFQEDHLRLL